MKNRLFSFCTLIIWSVIIPTVNAQIFSWSNQIGGNYDDYGRSGLCDNEGNFYFAGGFESDFCYFQTDTLVRHGKNDLFLAKYNPSGKELWVRQFGGWNEEFTESITAYFDTISGHIFISGSFYGTVSFGSYILTAKALDIFLAKYDLDGNCIWAKKFGGDGDDTGSLLTFDNSGNIYMCGSNSLFANFDDFVIPRGGFIAKFDPYGKCLWAKNKIKWAPLFNSQIRLAGIKISNSDIIIGGCMGVDDIINIDDLVISHKGFLSTLICCFDNNGTAKWIREGISIATESISNIAIDGNGNIFQTGYFADSINFYGNTLLSKSKLQEMFLVKYDKAGNVKWVKQSISDFSEGYNLATDMQGNVTVVGHFKGTAQFGDFKIKSITNEDMFLAGFDGFGNCQGVYNYENGRGSGISFDKLGNLYFTFLFNNSTSLGSKSFISNGTWDIIIAKCNPITGVEELKTTPQNQLLIYANPNTGKCNITIPEEFANEKELVLQIFDLQGKLIQQSKIGIADGKIKLDIQAQAKGMYTAVLSNGKRSYTGKIVFE